MSEFKELVKDLNQAFDEFKTANDERLNALEEKGTVDPLLEGKVDTANKAITDIETKLADASKKSEERIDELELAMNRKGLGGGGTSEREKIQDEAERFYALNKRHRGEEPDLDAYMQYCKAFDQVAKYGVDNVGTDIRNAASVASDPAGGFWVPVSTTGKIVQKIFDTSEIRALADNITIKSDRYELDKDVNDATSGGWVGEAASRAATATPEIGTHEIPVHEQYAMPKATQKSLDDIENFESWLVNKTSDKAVRTENTAFVSGNGVMKPRGFMDYSSAAVTTVDSSRSWGVLQYHFTGKSGDFKASGSGPADCLIEILTSKLRKPFRRNATWVMNSTTKAAVRKLKDSNDNYYLIPDLSGAGKDLLIGKPIAEFEDMDDISSNSFSIAVGDFRQGYLIVDRHGFRMLRDPLTDKPNVLFYMYKRTGADVINFDAIKLLKFSTS